MKKLLILTSLAIVPFFSVSAEEAEVVETAVDYDAQADQIQEYIAVVRGELSAGKVQSLTRALRLDASEASIFWPIYQEYEQELFDLGDQRFELIKQFAEYYREQSLGDEAASELIATSFGIDEQRMALRKKYFDIISEALSPVTAAQFIQLEYRFQTVIDLMLASEIPLIQPPARD